MCYLMKWERAGDTATFSYGKNTLVIIVFLKNAYWSENISSIDNHLAFCIRGPAALVTGVVDTHIFHPRRKLNLHAHMTDKGDSKQRKGGMRVETCITMLF